MAGVIGLNLLRALHADARLPRRSGSSCAASARRSRRRRVPRAHAVRDLGRERAHRVRLARRRPPHGDDRRRPALPACGVGAPRRGVRRDRRQARRDVAPGEGRRGMAAGPTLAAVTVPTVTVGPVVGDKVPGWSGALDSAELWRHGVRRDAILAGLLQGPRVTIDWGRRELIVEE